VWLAKSIEIFFAKRRVRAASKELAGIRSLDKVSNLPKSTARSRSSWARPAIPAAVIYNMFARSIAGYRAGLEDAAAEVLRLVSRDLERAGPVPAERALNEPDHVDARPGSVPSRPGSSRRAFPPRAKAPSGRRMGS
jgi:hypothetical protein